MKKLQQIPMLVLLLPMVAAILVWDQWKIVDSNGVLLIDSLQCYQIQLTSVPQLRNKTVKAEATVLFLVDSLSVTPIKEKVIVYFQTDSMSVQLQQGDVLLVDTRFRHSNRGNPYEFDYDTYLRHRGFQATGYVLSYAWEKLEHRTLYSPVAIADRCQNKLLKRYQSFNLSNDEFGVLAALTIGEKSYIDTDTRRQFAAAGAMHVLAVSGLHVGIIYMILQALLTFFGLFPVFYRQKARRICNAVILIVLIWIYAFITGLSASVVRASLMLTLFTLAPLFERPVNSFNIVFGSALLILMFSPQSLFSLSFLLSYSAVLAIIYFTPKFNKIFNPQNKLLKYVWGVITMSVAAQLGTLPITLIAFNQFPTFFILTNLVVVPGAFVIILTAALTLIFSVIPYIGPLLITILQTELNFFNSYVAWIDNLPVSTVVFSLNTPLMIVLLMIIMSVVLFFYQNKRVWLYSIILLSICFIGISYARMEKISNMSEQVIYNSTPANVVLVQEGRRCLLITDSVKSAMTITEPLRRHRMLLEPEILDIAALDAFSWNFHNEDFIIVRNKRWKKYATEINL